MGRVSLKFVKIVQSVIPGEKQFLGQKLKLGRWALVWSQARILPSHWVRMRDKGVCKFRSMLNGDGWILPLGCGLWARQGGSFIVRQEHTPPKLQDWHAILYLRAIMRSNQLKSIFECSSFPLCLQMLLINTITLWENLCTNTYATMIRGLAADPKLT